MNKRYRVVATVASLASLLMVQSAAAQGTLEQAKQFYAAAAYSEALGVLEEVKARRPTPSQALEIDQYRALCLLALGRTAAADETISAMVSANPFDDVEPADASPRVRAAFSEVRRRVLPGVAQEQYAAAKATFERKDFRAAAQQFERVLELLKQPEVAAGGPMFADLQVLASGFLTLSAAAAEAPTTGRSEALSQTGELKAVPVVQNAIMIPAVLMPARSVGAAAQAGPAASRIYGAADTGVTAPVAIREALPSWPRDIPVTFAKVGMIEIVIDEEGNVESAGILAPIAAVYDRMLLAAAKTWRYVPGKRGDSPIRFRKLVRVRVGNAPSS